MDPTQEFVNVVRRFCEWFESPPVVEDVLIAHRLLAELQLRILSLPQSDPDDEYVDVEDKVGVMEWRDRLAELPVTSYWKVYDVFADAKRPVFCLIADDLADIHADLSEGMHFYDKGNEAEALWRWQVTYFSHWGRHLTGAQTALHQYFADQGGVNNLTG
jgi:hypothetical protein